MTLVIRINPKQLPSVLEKESSTSVRLGRIAARRAAYRLKSHLVAQSDRLGITDRGMYKRSFVVNDNSVVNTSPHGPIVEEGARPHKLSREALEALAQWVRRKLRKTSYGIEQARDNKGRFTPGDKIVEKKKKYSRGRFVYAVKQGRDARGRFTTDEDVVKKKRGDEAMSIAWAIAKHIEKYGQKGRYVMKNSLPLAKKFFSEELNRLMTKRKR